MLIHFNPLPTNDAFWRRQILAACYQSVQSILKIGSALAERVCGTGGGGWVHCSAWQPMVAVAVACRKALVNAGWAICLLSPNLLSVCMFPHRFYVQHC